MNDDILSMEGGAPMAKVTPHSIPVLGPPQYIELKAHSIFCSTHSGESCDCAQLEELVTECD